MVLIIGLLTGFYFCSVGNEYMYDKYPVMDCIATLDQSMNIEANDFPFTAESQREAIQTVCAGDYLGLNRTEYDELFEFRNGKK